MHEDAMPWYVRGVIGIGAWVTAVVLIALGAAFVFALLDLESGAAFALFGAVFFALGLYLLWQGPSGVFGQQLGIATAAAGAAMIAGGLAVEAESLWVGCAVAVAAGGAIVAATTDRILQFLAAALVLGFYVAALLEARSSQALDLVALATPAGLLLLLYPPRRDLMPTAVALLFTFPFVTVFLMADTYWMRNLETGGTFARILHIVLFLGLVYLHARRGADNRANLQVLAFAVAAVLVCLLLPPGGSAAMLILMLAYVIGSKTFALLGAALQAQFIVRYYYSLEMNLLDKSLLLMGVGTLLLALWWLLRRNARGKVPA